VLRFG